DPLLDHGQIVGMNDFPPQLSRYRSSTLWLDAEQAAMLVRPEIRSAVDLPVIASDMGCFQTEPQQRFTGCQGLFGFPASRVRLYIDDGAADRPIRMPPGRHVQLHSRGRSIRANEEIFDIG